MTFTTVLLFLQGCSGPQMETVRVGVDSTWYPIDFAEETSYVNGFIQELLLEISKESSLQFIQVTANSDSLYEGVQKGNYSTLISSLLPSDETLSRYGFSDLLLPLGPVLIVPAFSSVRSLEEMHGQMVGTLLNDPALQLLIPYPTLQARPIYTSARELLSALEKREIDGALLSYIPAVQYVRDLFQGRLTIATPPLTPAGLRLITPKDDLVLFQFNKAFHRLQREGKWQALLVQWGFSP
ncbi:MAG: transporter substrate-binding domain-containing protein [Verrucomicrobiota bacterium]|nr:transporter substrate-binding domain-containing protein [Verrucomicrobiota bacterium]